METILRDMRNLLTQDFKPDEELGVVLAMAKLIKAEPQKIWVVFARHETTLSFVQQYLSKVNGMCVSCGCMYRVVMDGCNECRELGIEH